MDTKEKKTKNKTPKDEPKRISKTGLAMRKLRGTIEVLDMRAVLK